MQRKLEAIIEGEKPYDIYVRWKPLHEQPITATAEVRNLPRIARPTAPR